MLQRVSISGFKSIKRADIELKNLNILIGANGAGKSNLVSFFKMLNEIAARRLQKYIGMSGSTQSVLHFGPKVTPRIEASITFELEEGTLHYDIRLIHAAYDSLTFAEESATLLRAGSALPEIVSLGAGHQETRLGKAAVDGDSIARGLCYLFDRCRVYHFRDTSPLADIRQYCAVTDNRALKTDAGNLAAMLYRFRNDKAEYQSIISTIRLIAPFFDDFDLEITEGDDVLLNWRRKDSDQLFSPYQLSDGLLRAMALVTALLQPEHVRPNLIVVDEPELGLHPYALNIVAELCKKAAHHTQILISTQSSAFLDHFDPEDVMVVSQEGEESKFTRPDPNQLEAWLEDYSLGEVWQKNVIGGGPH
jgi:predicted ATPase